MLKFEYPAASESRQHLTVAVAGALVYGLIVGAACAPVLGVNASVAAASGALLFGVCAPLAAALSMSRRQSF